MVDYDGMVNDGEYDGSESDGDGRNERHDRGNGEDQDEDDDDDGEEDDKDEESKENFNTSSERTTQSSTLDSRTHRINDHTLKTNTPSARNRTDEPSTRRIETSTRNSRSGQESVLERSNKPDGQIADTTNKPTEPQTPRILNREMLLERTTRAQVAQQQQQQKDQKNIENDSLPNKRNGAFQIPSLQETVEKHGPGILYSPENLHNSDNVHNQPGESLQNPPLGALDENQCLGHLSERVQIRPITALGSVPLVHARVSYKEYYLDRNLIVLISHQPLYPLSRVHIPVFVYKQNVNAFVLR